MKQNFLSIFELIILGNQSWLYHAGSNGETSKSEGIEASSYTAKTNDDSSHDKPTDLEGSDTGRNACK